MPEIGEQITLHDIEMIFDLVAERGKKFPDEPGALTFAMVLMNVGDRFSTVQCTEQEWSGTKQEASTLEGLPICPNGHPLTYLSEMRLGWISS